MNFWNVTTNTFLAIYCCTIYSIKIITVVWTTYVLLHSILWGVNAVICSSKASAVYHLCALSHEYLLWTFFICCISNPITPIMTLFVEQLSITYTLCTSKDRACGGNHVSWYETFSRVFVKKSITWTVRSSIMKPRCSICCRCKSDISYCTTLQVDDTNFNALRHTKIVLQGVTQSKKKGLYYYLPRSSAMSKVLY